LTDMLRLASTAVDRPIACLLAVTLLTLALAAGLPRLTLRTDGAMLYPAGNPTVEHSAADAVAFRDSPLVILLVTARPGGPGVASGEGLRFLRAVHEDVGALQGVRASGVRSGASLVEIPTGAESVTVRPILDTIPDAPAEFAARVRRLREYSLTDGLLLSSDGQAAAVYIPLAENSTPKNLVSELERWITTRRGAGFDLRLTGPLVAETTLGDMVLDDLLRLVPMMVLAIATLLFVTLRSAGGVIVPMIEAVVVLVWTLGAMAYGGVPVTLMTTVLPVVLMAISVTDEIHLLERVQGRLAEVDAPNGPNEAHRRSMRKVVVGALEEVGPPIVRTSLTTAMGFLAFLATTIAPLRHFGLFTAFGILIAMVLSFTLIPALMVVLPTSWFCRGGTGRRAGDSTAILPQERLAARHSGAGFGIGLALVVLSMPGLVRLRVQDAWVDNFDPTSDLVTAERDFNARFWGSYRFDVVFDGPDEYFYRPEGTALMAEFSRAARDGPRVGGVLTHVGVLGELATAIGERRSVLELTAGEVADLSTIAEVVDRDGLRQLLSPNGDSARARVFVNSADYQRALALDEYLVQALGNLSAGRNVRYHFSGELPLAMELVRAVVSNQVRSIAWALVGVGLLLFIALRRLALALGTMVPVMTAALFLFAIMGYLGVPLGIATSMFASLAIGVGVDFAVHLQHGYERERLAGRDHECALRAALGTVGKAVRWNVRVLGLGFLVLALSDLQPDRRLGLLLAGAVFTCYGTTLLFLPRILGRLAPVLAIAGLVLTGCARTDVSVGEADIARDEAVAAMPAEQLMLTIEEAFRSGPRAARMAVTDIRPGGESTRSTIWGIFGGDPENTRILYIFTEPERIRGTSLLLADHAARGVPDQAWLYLPSMEYLRALNVEDQRLLVPGTALSYNDSRGFIPGDLYAFEYDSGPAETRSGEDLRLVARPATEEIRESLGYDALAIHVDPEKHLVTRVEYRDLNRQPLKTYEVLGEVEVGGVWLPKKIRVEHFAEGILTEIDYEYWSLSKRPNEGVFEPNVDQSDFLPRLEAVLGAEGIDVGLDTRRTGRGGVREGR